MVLDFPAKTITLYNKANVKQKDINLDAYKIVLDQDKQLMIATPSKDTAGAMIGQPKFVQGTNNMTGDTLIFNTKTQKGYTRNTYTDQEEMFVHAQQMKKISKNEYFAWKGRITTCDLDPPHFAFVADKMKLVNGKLAITGPIHPEFEGVPIPIYLPFGFFPLSQGRHSGLLPPQFTVNQQFGLGLEGLGYYKVLNDNFDLTTRGDIYSYGGYRINVTPTYRVRYRYQGSMTFSFQNSRILSDLGTQEYTTTKTFNLSWSHTVDSRARPGQTFSASVNAGSTKYNQFQTVNSQLAYQNQLSSSITYSKNWSNLYNLTVSANHQQNNLTRLVSVNLPNMAFTVNNFYPLQRKQLVGEAKWYEKLGIGLNSSLANQISFYDSALTVKRLLDTLNYGAQHSIPISLALPSLGPLQISPGISYRENWYGRKVINQWSDKDQKVDTTSTKGFYRSSDVSLSLGVNTALYGMYDRSAKGGSLMAIRHTMRPSFSVSYDPGLAKKDYYTAQIDSSHRTANLSYYQNSMFGSLTGQAFGGMSFGIDNNLEMKVRSKKDTSNAGIKKVKLIDGFGFNGSYNFLADSMKLSNISLYLRSTLFEKINITAGANLDPYQQNRYGTDINKYAWEGGKFSLGNITTGNVAISTSFKSKPKDKSVDSAATANASNNELYRPLTLEEQQAQLQYIRNNPAQFADFNITWSLNVSYSLSFSRVLRPDYSGYNTILNSNVNLSGDFNLTEKWKVGMSTYYDFNGSGLQNVTAFLSRDLHCWQMSINVYSGVTRGFNITINPKSGLLKDLKINRSRYFYNY
jgi:lipopolysaccharide assembly outer membrane protein LptD (OstA)